LNDATWKGISHAKRPSRQRTFTPNPVPIRGSTSKSRRPTAHANNATAINNDIDFDNIILEFIQCLHPTTKALEQGNRWGHN